MRRVWAALLGYEALSQVVPIKKFEGTDMKVKQLSKFPTRTNIALAMIAACFVGPTNTALADTLFRSAPWIVSNDTGLDGQPACTISGLTPYAGLSITATSEQNVYVQAFENAARHPLQGKILVIRLPGDETFMWDAQWMREIAVAELDLSIEYENNQFSRLVQAFNSGGSFTFFQARGSMTQSAWRASHVSISLPSGAQALAVFDACVMSLPENS